MMPTPNRFMSQHRYIDWPVVMHQIEANGYRKCDVSKILGITPSRLSDWQNETQKMPEALDLAWKILDLWFCSHCVDKHDLISTLEKLPLK
jgi:hypothetical protein